MHDTSQDIAAKDILAIILINVVLMLTIKDCREKQTNMSYYSTLSVTEVVIDAMEANTIQIDMYSLIIVIADDDI